MKVILLRDIYKHGVAGEVVEVADGFARNYLIPRGMAQKADRGALKSHTKLMEQVEARRSQYENMLNDLARQIDGVELIFERRAASTGTLFGSVTTQDIADALNEKTGVDINRRRISQQSLRELGEYDMPVRLGSEISPLLHIVIVREGELDEFLREREEAAAAAAAAEASESADAYADVTSAETEMTPETVAAEAVAQADAAEEDAE
ncbi:MAG: 50S ribosomal protein L9 [Anaerolineae bacterium]|nr:50S ribosomal protein L9 [Anaerolineae bacterium]